MSEPAESYETKAGVTVDPDGSPAKTNLPMTTEDPRSVAPSREESATGAAIRNEGHLVSPVPRISIQVFCESSDTANAFQRATEDRRLAKAHMTVQMGGITGAVEHFQDTPTPNLVVVEANCSQESLFTQLGQLAQVCDPSTKVIVVGGLNDISMYRDLIRQGLNEYLVTPLSTLQVIDSISALYVDPDAPPIGRNIVFTGAKGGVGSSTLAHNVAWFLSEKMNEDVTVVDLDLPFGTAGLDFNQDPTQGIADALTSPERVDDVLLDRLLVKCSERLSLFTAPGTLDREFDLDPDAFESVLDIVRKSVPCVIIDMPHMWTAWSKSIILSADEVIITATPELASLRNTKNLFERVKLARPNDTPPRVVLNQTGITKRPEIPTKDFAEAIGTDPTLVLQFEPHLYGTAANNGQMLGEVDANAQASQSISHLASMLIGRDAPVQKKPSLMDLIVGKKRSA